VKIEYFLYHNHKCDIVSMAILNSQTSLFSIAKIHSFLGFMEGLEVKNVKWKSLVSFSSKVVENSWWYSCPFIPC